MPLNAEFLADDRTAAAAPTGAVIYGARPAVMLGAALVGALALVTLLRCTTDTTTPLEKVVQQPLPADALLSPPRADLTAPDPGDSPP